MYLGLDLLSGRQVGATFATAKDLAVRRSSGDGEVLEVLQSHSIDVERGREGA
jgi:hypothetical protein